MFASILGSRSNVLRQGQYGLITLLFCCIEFFTECDIGSVYHIMILKIEEVYFISVKQIPSRP